jgi:hypothetical protein
MAATPLRLPNRRGSRRTVPDLLRGAAEPPRAGRSAVMRIVAPHVALLVARHRPEVAGSKRPIGSRAGLDDRPGVGPNVTREAVGRKVPLLPAECGPRCPGVAAGAPVLVRVEALFLVGATSSACITAWNAAVSHLRQHCLRRHVLTRRIEELNK